jgi:hypothetical protein
MRWWIVVLALLAAQAAHAEGFAAYCHRVGIDDTVRPMPAEYGPAFQKAFGLNIAPNQAQGTGVVRCAQGAVMACSIGANLPCGKADTSRSKPAADAWCRANNNPAVIPAYVLGHATIYQWQCKDGRAVAGAPIEKLDARGFIARYWKRLN